MRSTYHHTGYILTLLSSPLIHPRRHQMHLLFTVEVVLKGRPVVGLPAILDLLSKRLEAVDLDDDLTGRLSLMNERLLLRGSLPLLLPQLTQDHVRLDAVLERVQQKSHPVVGILRDKHILHEKV